MGAVPLIGQLQSVNFVLALLEMRVCDKKNIVFSFRIKTYVVGTQKNICLNETQIQMFKLMDQWFYFAYFIAEYGLLPNPKRSIFFPTWEFYWDLFPNSKGTGCIQKKALKSLLIRN